MIFSDSIITTFFPNFGSKKGLKIVNM